MKPVELGTAQFWQDLREHPANLAALVCFVDLDNLEETLQRHAPLRAWINATHEVARGEEDRTEHEVKKARARALLRASKVMGDSGKAKAVDILKAEADIDPEVDEAMLVYLAAKDKRGALRAMSGALEDRLQMLIQISAKQREEGRDYNRR